MTTVKEKVPKKKRESPKKKDSKTEVLKSYYDASSSLSFSRLDSHFSQYSATYNSRKLLPTLISLVSIYIFSFSPQEKIVKFVSFLKILSVLLSVISLAILPFFSSNFTMRLTPLSQSHIVVPYNLKSYAIDDFICSPPSRNFKNCSATLVIPSKFYFETLF